VVFGGHVRLLTVGTGRHHLQVGRSSKLHRTAHRGCQAPRPPGLRRAAEAGGRSDRAYIAPFRDPATVHAICEEYRAAATLDVVDDEADYDRRRITCPTLVLWGATGAVGRWYDPLTVWRAWATDVRGGPIDAGHFLPEEAPDETLRHLLLLLT
jgi:pimeloyl-ACP methyl ester carboxylesterase